MRQFPRTLAAALLAVALAGCSLDYPAPRKFALVVGINNNPHTNTLFQCINDATDMAAMLTAHGFAPIDVRILTEGGARKLDIQNAIADISTQIGPNDLFLFYYSGHGGSLEYQGSDHEWIFPWDSVDTGGYIIGDQAIVDVELGGMLEPLSTKRKVVILDACNSGGFIGKGLEADTVPPRLYGNTLWSGAVTPAVIARAVGNWLTFTTVDNGGISATRALTLSAAGTEELSWESSAYGNGVMTYFLLQSATEGDLNGDGFVTVLEAFALAKAGVDTYWNKEVAPQAVFSPHVSGGPIDLVLF